MKDIFANLYNKVLSFFSRTDSQGENAKEVACNRLKLVLMQDRTNLTPAIMDRMRRELVELLSKYVELDRELLDLNFEHEDEQMALMLSIPVIRAKNEDEVIAILEKEDEEKRKLKELLGEEIDEDEEDIDDDEDEDEEDDENDETESEASDDDTGTSEVKSKKQLKKEKFFKEKKTKKQENKEDNQEDNQEETVEETTAETEEDTTEQEEVSALAEE